MDDGVVWNQGAIITMAIVGWMINIGVGMIFTYALVNSDLLPNPVPVWYRILAIALLIVPGLWLVAGALAVSITIVSAILYVLWNFLTTGEV